MRVIGGALGSRLFKSPLGHRTHPMSEKARGGLFNVLGDISGLTVLDCFAGSGALSLEAISRGASSAVALDIDRSAVKTIRDNALELGVSDRVKVVHANAIGWLANNMSESFDIVFLDPPYDNIKPHLLLELANCTRPGGIAVLSLPPNTTLNMPREDYERIGAKLYGDAKLEFYRKT